MWSLYSMDLQEIFTEATKFNPFIFMIAYIHISIDTCAMFFFKYLWCEYVCMCVHYAGKQHCLPLRLLNMSVWHKVIFRALNGCYLNKNIVNNNHKHQYLHVSSGCRCTCRAYMTWIFTASNMLKQRIYIQTNSPITWCFWGWPWVKVSKVIGNK